MPRLVTIAFVCGLATFSAAQAAPRPGANLGETSAGKPDKIVCKRFTRIGSLVDGYRTCKTKKEWERERENVRTINWSSPCNQAANGCGGV
ncbi:MAG TPA: hypothetical protein VF535_02715 [Allosphingosinicella sp.]|jgi:hypothetical protein